MPDDDDGGELRPQPGVLLPLLVLFGCGVVAIVLLRLGQDPIIRTEDVVLHGGWSFLLMLAGCWILRHAIGVLARAQEWMIFFGVVMLGVGLEVVQHYLRIDSTVGDVAIDITGATAGWAFWRLCMGIEARMKGAP